MGESRECSAALGYADMLVAPLSLEPTMKATPSCCPLPLSQSALALDSSTQNCQQSLIKGKISRSLATDNKRWK